MYGAEYLIVYLWPRKSGWVVLIFSMVNGPLCGLYQKEIRNNPHDQQMPMNIIEHPRKKTCGCLKSEARYPDTGIGTIAEKMNTIIIHFLYGINISASFSILLSIIHGHLFCNILIKLPCLVKTVIFKLAKDFWGENIIIIQYLNDISTMNAAIHLLI